MIQKLKNWIKNKFCKKDELYNLLNTQYNDLYTIYNINLKFCEEVSKKLKTKPYEIALNQFKKVNQQYKGKNLRTWLNDFSNDTVSQEKYLAFLKELDLKDSYKDIDEAVYRIVSLIHKYIDSLPYGYKSDKEQFGKNDYWLTPQEAFEYYVTNESPGDCEDTAHFIYGCLVSGLNYLGYNWSNRLLRVDITFPVGHAILAWLKDNGIWACIESTYHEERFSKNWVENKDMFKGVYTTIWHIFNEVKEYRIKGDVK